MKQIYGLFYETRHYGFMIEFVNHERAEEAQNDPDNFDLIPFIATYDETHNVLYCPNLEDLHPWDLNQITFGNQINDFEILIGKIKIGEIIL